MLLCPSIELIQVSLVGMPHISERMRRCPCTSPASNNTGLRSDGMSYLCRDGRSPGPHVIRLLSVVGGSSVPPISRHSSRPLNRPTRGWTGTCITCSPKLSSCDTYQVS